MLGHGYTDKPDYPYGIDVYSDHLLAVIQELNLDRRISLGNTWGVGLPHGFLRIIRNMRSQCLNTPGNVNSKPEVMKALKKSTIKAVSKRTMKM